MLIIESGFGRYAEKRKCGRIDMSERKDFLYYQFPNWEEEVVDENAETCWVFFSSNGLYKDDLAEFEKTMLQDNRFEWKSIAGSLKKRKRIKKIIYVRDVYKEFYIKGINPDYPSIDALIGLLKEKVQEDKLITVGVSSGGYMAVIAGCLLNAQKVFCISGQFDLSGHLTQERLKEFIKINGDRYADTVDLIKASSNVPIYYFVPVNCNHDYLNYKLVKNISNVRCFCFPDKLHAATVYPFNFPDILYSSNKKLDALALKYNHKIINKRIFLLQTMTFQGMWEFFKRIFKSKFSVRRMKQAWDIKR